MSWWQWALMLWFGFDLLLVLTLLGVDWWSGHALDREWKQFNRSIR